MTDPLNWEAWYGQYTGYWSAVFSGLETEFQLPEVAIRRLTDPTPPDARWLTEALRDGGQWPQSRKWFVSSLVRHLTTLPEFLFRPMLDAAIDEVNPSANRDFVEPCMRSFGPRRVNEYLLSVVESGTDFRKAGAVNALYWANPVFLFLGNASVAPESRGANEDLRDIWDRERCLFLETFVANPSVDVRRSIIARLNLNPQNYPESHRALVPQAIQIARSHTDEYIRHRVEVQLGDVSGGFAPLPYRHGEEPTG